MPRNKAVTRDGIDISYEIHRGSGPGRCVLVHSLALDAEFWAGTVPYLIGDADVLVYDCRGHGQSGQPAGAQPVERHADDLADLLDAVGWQSEVVAGASMGGCISLAFARHYPQRVDGLGLFDTTAWYGPDAPKAWEERGQKAMKEGMAALIPFQKSRWVTEAFLASHPQVVEAAIKVFTANRPEIYLETCRMLGAADIRDLPKFDFATRIAVGIEDYATPVAMAEALHALIPGSSLTVFDKARHLTPLESPDRVGAEIKALLDGARARQAKKSS